MEFSPDGDYLLTAKRDGIRLWSLDGEAVASLGDPGGPRHLAVAFSDDGLRIATLPEAVDVENLLPAIDAGAPAARRRAIKTIGWFGPAAAPAVTKLIAALGSESRLVRKEAVIALGKIGPAAKAAIEPSGPLIGMWPIRPKLG